MKRPVLAIAAGILALSTPALAQETADSASSEGGAEAQADAKSQEVVCRQLEAPINSRIRRKKTCLTRAQWEAKAEADREVVDDTMQRGRMSRDYTTTGG